MPVDQSNIETDTVVRQEDSVAIQCMRHGDDCKAILLSLARGIDRVNTKLSLMDKTLAENQVVTMSTQDRVQKLEAQRCAILTALAIQCIVFAGGVALYLITGKT